MTKHYKKRKFKFSLKTFCCFIIFEFVFTAITAPFILLYGPFKVAKKTYVGAAMTTLSHQWLATTFLSEERINNILNSSSEEEQNTENTYDIENTSAKVTLPVKTDNTMQLYSFGNSKYKGYYLIISDPKRIFIGYSKYLGDQGQTVSQMAKESRAVAAINGGAFHDESTKDSLDSSKEQWNGNGGQADGVIISDGQVKFSNVPKDKKTEVFAMTKDGEMLAGKYTLKQLKDRNVVNAVSFYPTLVKNGHATGSSIELEKWGIGPRTAIGQRADGAIVFMVIEGRSITSPGASLKELQGLLIEKTHVVTAINLDGGRSSTLYLNGKVVNKLSSNIGERCLPSSILVK